MDQADLHVVGEDDGEMDRIDARAASAPAPGSACTSSSVAVDLQEAAEYQQQHVDREQELPGRRVWSSVNCTSFAGTPDSVIQWPNANAVAMMSMMLPALAARRRSRAASACQRKPR